jgi:DNA-binding MarR family transcriptional regulator
MTPAALDQSQLTHLVGYAASRAAQRMRKVCLHHLDPLGLKVVEFSILVLVDSNADVNQRQLGEALELSPPNLAIMLDRMAERGWIERVRSAQDRRAMQIHLTASGRSLAQRAQQIAATMEQAALQALSGAERAMLIELLLKVARGQPRRR